MAPACEDSRNLITVSMQPLIANIELNYWICQSCYMDLIDTWISLSCYLDLSKLMPVFLYVGFVKVST